MERSTESTTKAAQISIMAQLSVRRGRAAIEFYKAAFGAEETYRVGGTAEQQEVVAQLSVGGASFWLSDESPPHKNFSPESLGGSTARLLLIVEDPQVVVERAVASGATSVTPVQEEHGWLLGRIEDPFDHHWEIGRPLGSWPPAPTGQNHDAVVSHDHHRVDRAPRNELQLE